MESVQDVDSGVIVARSAHIPSHVRGQVPNVSLYTHLALRRRCSIAFPVKQPHLWADTAALCHDLDGLKSPTQESVNVFGVRWGFTGPGGPDFPNLILKLSDRSQ